jgi:hypothetical protein
MKTIVATFLSLSVILLPVDASALGKKKKADTGDSTLVVVTGRSAPRNNRVFNKGELLTITLTETANLRALAKAAGYDGESHANILFVVPKGVTIAGKSNGGKGIETGKWPPGVTLGLAINGRVCGGGGKGGDGWGQTGGRGGDAIYIQTPIMIVVAEKGAVEGGGGGGGGARAIGGVGAGGGGGGFPNGFYGMGFSGGDSGREGNPSGGGRGGNNRSMFKGETLIPPFDRGIIGTIASPVVPGGNGGDPGMDGDYVFDGGGGGLAGFAVRANGYPVDFVVAGRVRGQIG